MALSEPQGSLVCGHHKLTATKDFTFSPRVYVSKSAQGTKGDIEDFQAMQNLKKLVISL